MKATIRSLMMVLIAIPVGAAHAQRGMGQKRGVAREGVETEMRALEGTVTAVETHACPETTGHGYWGTHLKLETEDRETFNVHVGPHAAVSSLIEGVEAGDALRVEAFRTDRMPDDHYVARALEWGERTVKLRDERLRPVWAGRRGAGSRAAAPRAGRAARNAGPRTRASSSRGRAMRGQGMCGQSMRRRAPSPLMGRDPERLERAAARLRAKLAAMKGAEGQAKVAAMVKVVDELVGQHLAIMERQRMMRGPERPRRRMGPGARRGPATQPSGRGSGP